MLTQIQSLLIPYKINSKKRLGSQIGDGGYVVCTDYLSNHLISCGCANNTSFEENYLQHQPSAKIDIYDGTSACDLAKDNIQIEFHKNNVYSIEDLNLSDNCFIQMDIEGHELSIFRHYKEEFKKIQQMCLEIHLNMVGDEGNWINLLTNLKKHHTLIHIHANNYEQSIKYGVPSVLELTYLRSDKIKTFEQETIAYPISGLDIANTPKNQEISMSWWIES